MTFVSDKLVRWLNNEIEMRGLSQRERLALAYAGSTMQPDVYRKTDDTLLQRMAGEQARLDQLEQQLGALPNLDERRRALLALGREFVRLLRVAEPPEIARLLQSAGVSVWIEQNRVVRIEP